MKKTLLIVAGFLVAFTLGFFIRTWTTGQPETKVRVAEEKKTESESAIPTHPEKEGHLRLGAFSVSLSVKDLEASMAFYETLGFSHFGGDPKQHYVIMKNGNALIGLFQGMFEGNLLTFNPGWDENAQNVDDFDDIRTIQQRLKANSIKLDSEADEKTTGPASLMAKDPDGNVVLIDQHR
jgi:catechol 2,3-dioxygenase-like lactoylglutathione lyase family enzyme